jgi:hypothetical protein
MSTDVKCTFPAEKPTISRFYQLIAYFASKLFFVVPKRQDPARGPLKNSQTSGGVML